MSSKPSGNAQIARARGLLAKAKIVEALSVLGADAAWPLAAQIFMRHAAGLEMNGTSKEQALQNALLCLGQECENMKLENGLFGQALANALAAELIIRLGAEKAVQYFEDLARLTRDQFEPKGKVNLWRGSRDDRGWEEGRRKKEEGRRKKEEGRRKKEEGRRKKEEGRRKKEEGRRKKEEG